MQQCTRGSFGCIAVVDVHRWGICMAYVRAVIACEIITTTMYTRQILRIYKYNNETKKSQMKQ